MGFWTACVFWSGLARSICHSPLSPTYPKATAAVVSEVWPLTYLYHKGFSSWVYWSFAGLGKWKENSSGKEKGSPRRAQKRPRAWCETRAERFACHLDSLKNCKKGPRGWKDMCTGAQLTLAHLHRCTLDPVAWIPTSHNGTSWPNSLNSRGSGFPNLNINQEILEVTFIIATISVLKVFQWNLAGFRSKS